MSKEEFAAMLAEAVAKGHADAEAQAKAEAEAKKLAAAASGLIQPRLGGLIPLCVWTSGGAGGKGLTMASRYCVRQFAGDPIKGFQAMTPIETRITTRSRRFPA